MGDSFGKREIQRRKQQRKKEKEERKVERQSQAKSGSLEDMLAYIDENGNLSSRPPDPKRKNIINENDVIIGSRNFGGVESELTRKGRVIYFNELKGYGFIKDSETEESIFVHLNALNTPVKTNDVVSFQTERGLKGLTATGVKKV